MQTAHQSPSRSTGASLRAALATALVQAVGLAPPSASAPSSPTPAPRRNRRRRSRDPVTITRWIQRDVETAQQMAGMGDLSKAAQLYRALARDGMVKGLLGTRTGGLVRLPKRFAGDAAAVAYLQGEDGRPGRFRSIYPNAELARLDADGIVLGVGVGEFLDVECLDYPVFCRLDPEFLRYERWSDRWYYEGSEGRELVEPGNGRWILHTPGGRQDPWNSGLIWALSRAFVAKEHGFFYRENWNGKLANAARVAIAPLAATDVQSDAWFQKVLAWGVNTVFGLKPGYDVKLIESNGHGYESFKETIADSNQEVQVAIAGQVVTTTGGVGFANAAVFQTIRVDLIQDDGEGLADTLNAQGLPVVLRGRVPAGAIAALAWDTRPPANMKAEAESISAAVKAIDDYVTLAEKIGIAPDARSLLARFTLPVGEDIDGDARPDTVEAPPTDESKANLAAKMTELAIARCEHNHANRCWLCGVERVREVVDVVDGVAQWKIVWRPIAAAVAPLREAV